MRPRVVRRWRNRLKKNTNEGQHLLNLVAAPGRTYDVAPDGERFLMIAEGGGAEDTSAPAELPSRVSERRNEQFDVLLIFEAGMI